jgi:hypothetical protein
MFQMLGFTAFLYLFQDVMFTDSFHLPSLSGRWRKIETFRRQLCGRTLSCIDEWITCFHVAHRTYASTGPISFAIEDVGQVRAAG